MRLLTVLLLGAILATAGACSATQVRVVQSTPAATAQTGSKRSALQVEKAGRALLEELVWIVAPDGPTAASRASVWRLGALESTTQAPPPIPQFAVTLLRAAYADVPRPILATIVWQDSVPSFAALPLGVYLNRGRIAEVAATADSVSASPDRRGMRDLLVRPPGDWAIVLLAGHELAHLALDASGATVREPSSVVECSADVLAGFQLAVLSTQASSRGEDEIGWSDVLSSVGNALAAGDWVARELHPDREERVACFSAGVQLFNDQGFRQSIASAMIVNGRADSLRRELSLGHTSLIAEAIDEARVLLPMPSSGAAAASQTTQLTLDRIYSNPYAAELARVTGVLLGMIDSAGVIHNVAGSHLSAGATLFPSVPMSEFTVRVGDPWKCAVLGLDAGRRQSVACYAVASSYQLMYFPLVLGDAISKAAQRVGFECRSTTPPTMRDSHFVLQQWALERGRRRVLVTYNTESLESAFGFRHDAIVACFRLRY